MAGTRTRRGGTLATLVGALTLALVAGTACSSDEGPDATGTGTVEPTSTVASATAPGTDGPSGPAEPTTGPEPTATVTVTVTETADCPAPGPGPAPDPGPAPGPGPGPAPGPGPGPGAGACHPEVSVADLERALERDIERDYPMVGPGTAECEASGRLRPWTPVLCYFLPDDPAEFGGIHVSVVPGCGYAWGLGECCDGGPWPDAYPGGMSCADLLEPPPGSSPGRWLPDDDQLPYSLAVYYWLTEGRPSRMDTDGDGRPCEAVYPRGEVADYWQSVQPLRPSD